MNCHYRRRRQSAAVNEAPPPTTPLRYAAFAPSFDAPMGLLSRSGRARDEADNALLISLLVRLYFFFFFFLIASSP